MPTLQLPTWNQGYDYWDIPKENNEIPKKSKRSRRQGGKWAGIRNDPRQMRWPSSSLQMLRGNMRYEWKKLILECYSSTAIIVLLQIFFFLINSMPVKLLGFQILAIHRERKIWTSLKFLYLNLFSLVKEIHDQSSGIITVKSF